ncbi:hypothetical protein [Actinocrispum sp. NPDC049592]|uniref:hypothetical protein n=1 Tax=Actinocrispum sp. NPDC049592 TaxID=3154835 RepID=UPI003429617A
MRYLGSTKNLAGSAAGLLGIVLYLFGLLGSYWPVVVIGLYAAGALLAPADRIRKTTLEDIAELRKELFASTVDRLPAQAQDHVARIRAILTDMLDRPTQLAASADLLHRVTRLTRADLPMSLRSYENLPQHDQRAATELLTQLELLETEAHRIAAAFYANDLQNQADHTRYLRERGE